MKKNTSTPPPPDESGEILRVARRRAFGTRPVLHLLAITAWSAFLGAGVLLAAWLIALPDDGEPLGLDRIAMAFATLWVLAAVPALSAALLARAPPAASSPEPPARPVQAPRTRAP